jgi:paraquat-inducible protein B
VTARPAVVGAFILGALGLGVAAILFFGGMRLFTKTTRAVTFFDESVAGLDVGAPVTFHGVRIGSVKGIVVRFSAGDTMTARVPVFIELRPNQIIWEGKRLAGTPADFDRLIHAGLRAQLGLQSLITGQLRVDLDFRPGAPARLVGTALGVPEIPSVPSEMGQVWEQLTKLRLQDLADSAQRAFAAVERLSTHVDSVIGPLADNTNRGIDAARQTLQTTDKAVRQLQAEASTTLRDLDSLLVDAHRQLDARGGELGRTLVAADRAARQAEILLNSLNGLAEPRSDFRDNLEAAVRDLAASASALRGFAETIERNPNALLTGRPAR